MTKITDTQLLILSKAAQRDDHSVEPHEPDRFFELLNELQAAERRMRRSCLAKRRSSEPKAAEAGVDGETRHRSAEKEPR